MCLDPEPDPILKKSLIRIRFVLRGWIRIRIRNPAQVVTSYQDNKACYASRSQFDLEVILSSDGFRKIIFPKYAKVKADSASVIGKKIIIEIMTDELGNQPDRCHREVSIFSNFVFAPYMMIYP